MASKKILAQLELQTVSSLTSPASGFVGFSAKPDGLYQKIGTAPELRLLTSADVQNAILADGSITGAVSQAQIFTMGVKLYNLTQGYIAYASGSTKLLSNSPIYTDGTNVGIGTTNTSVALNVVGTINSTTGNFTSSGGDIYLKQGANTVFRGVRASSAWSDSVDTQWFQVGNSNDYIAFTTQYGSSATRMLFATNSFNINTGVGNTAPIGLFDISNGSTKLFNVLTNGNVGIGTPAPNQQLEITKNFRLPTTIGTTPYGIIYKDTTPFIHDFNYGNNGTVTIIGRNTFVGLNAGNLTMGSTATYVYESSYNVGFGFYSLISNTTGYYNSAVGYGSLQNNTTGNYNSAFGANSLYSNTIGSGNIALGLGAGQYIANGTTGRTTGNNGLYLGVNSKASADGTDNEIVIGYNAIGAGSNKSVIGNSSVTDTYFGSSAGSSKLWATALNLSSLTASKVVFTDGSKNLTSTGIGTSSQFIKGDGSLDSNTYITSGSVSGFVPYLGATESVQLGSHDLHCSVINTSNAIIGNILVFTDTIVEGEQGIYMYPDLKLATYNSDGLYYSYGNDKLKVSEAGDVSIDKALFVGNGNPASYTDGGYFNITTPQSSYAGFGFYSKDTYDDFGIVSINANPEEGILLSAKTNDNSKNSELRISANDFSFYTNSLNRLIIAQNGSINAFGNTITSTGGFIGNASTATKLQTARNITIGYKTLSFDGSANVAWTLAEMGAQAAGSYAASSHTHPISQITSLQTTLDSKAPTTSQFVQSIRDFPLGTLISTTIDYSQTNGESFLLELKGNTYGGGVPLDMKVQGYIYSDSIIYTSGYTVNNAFTYVRAMNIGGFLCFWIPTGGYWQGFDAFCSTTGGTGSVNKVTTITNSAEPAGTKKVTINLTYTGGGSYTLPTASTTVLGGVKIDGTSVKLNGSNQLYVSTNYEAPLTFTGGLSRTGNTVSFTGSISGFVPYNGATANVNVGSYVMYANNFILNSDARLKCNIELIESKNIDIDYKKYEFKSAIGNIRYGVIAQDLLKIAPEFVDGSEDSGYSVKYIDLLIHEIAYLKQEIKKLTGGN